MNRVEIKTIHTETTKDLERYINQKISKLDNYMPRHARKSAFAEVRLSEGKDHAKKRCTVEVSLQLPGETITASDSTVSMYASVDMVEDKLKAQLRKYKASFSAKRGHRETQVRAFLGKIIHKKQ